MVPAPGQLLTIRLLSEFPKTIVRSMFLCGGIPAYSPAGLTPSAVPIKLQPLTVLLCSSGLGYLRSTPHCLFMCAGVLFQSPRLMHPTLGAPALAAQDGGTVMVMILSGCTFSASSDIGSMLSCVSAVNFGIDMVGP